MVAPAPRCLEAKKDANEIYRRWLESIRIDVETSTHSVCNSLFHLALVS